MSGLRVQDSAGHRLDEIHRTTRNTRGDVQAERSIRGLSDRLTAITDRRFRWRPIPAELAVDGYVCRYAQHLICWKLLADGPLGIVTILHERMHQIDRFKDDFAS